MDRLTTMEAFVRVVDAGGFSAAARGWGRSKAVLSKYVSALESHLGVALLHRTTRSLSLTEAGRAYHERCVDLLGEIDALEASVRADHVALRGTLRVTAPPGFASRRLPLMTSEFVARHPMVSVDLDLTHRMVDLVEEGIDIAIRMTDPRDSSLVARRIAPAPVIAVAAPAYLGAHGTPERPSELRAHACLVDTNFRDRQRWPFRIDGRREVVEVRGPVRINSPTAVAALAVAAHGIALVPRLVVEEELATGRLVEVLAGTVALDWGIYAVYPRRRHLPARVRAYVDHLVVALDTRPGRSPDG